MALQQYDATLKQRLAIEKLCRILRIPCDVYYQPLTRQDARKIQWELLCRVRGYTQAEEKKRGR